MKKITKVFEVYNFEELDKEVQKKILDEAMEQEKNLYCEWSLYDAMVEEAKNLLKKCFSGSSFVNVYYSLSYLQGDGAMIEFKTNLESLNNKYKLLSEEEITGLANLGNTSVIVYHQGNYCHEYSFNVEYEDYTMYNYMEEWAKDMEKIQNKIDEMIENFKKDIVNINKDLARYGYSILEDEDYFRESALQYLDDLEFLKNGEVFKA